MKAYFQEIFETENCNVKLKILKGVDELARQNWDSHIELKKIIEGRVKKDKHYKQHAFPDSIQAGADPFEPLYINQIINTFSLYVSFVNENIYKSAVFLLANRLSKN